MAVCTPDDLAIPELEVTEERCRVINRLSGFDKDPTLQLFGVEMPAEDLVQLQDLAGSFRKQAVVNIVEIGSWTGRSALAMLDACPNATIYCVDHWHGSPTDSTSKIAGKMHNDAIFQAFTSNIGTNLFRRIIPCRGSSDQWAAVWPFQADMIFIDADHSYEACKQDIRMWMPHVRPGGILAGHDYDVFAGVSRAVGELPLFVHGGKSIWFTRIK